MTIRKKYEPKIQQINAKLVENNEKLQTLDEEFNVVKEDVNNLKYKKSILINPNEFKFNLRQKIRNKKTNIFAKISAWLNYFKELPEINKIIKCENIYEVIQDLASKEIYQDSIKQEIFDLEKSNYDLKYALEVYERTSAYFDQKEKGETKLYTDRDNYFKPNKGYKRVLVKRRMEMGR